MNDLSNLLHEAVDDVEPTDRLTQIRSAVRRRHSHRLWVVSGGGAAIAAAATVAAVALANHPGTSAGPDVATGPPSVSTPTTDASTGPVEGAGSAVAVYYLGGSTDAPKLYREFRTAAGVDSTNAAIELLMMSPVDPDYRTLWPVGSLDRAYQRGDRIEVAIGDPSVRERPSTMSRAQAEAAVQQVIYTVQAQAKDRLPVQFTYQGNPIDQVLGVPTSEPLANAPVLQTLSRVNLTTPAEGQEVTGTLQVEGVSNSNEANVAWLIEDSTGTDVASGAITAEGWMGEKLFPFQDSLDVSSLDPGTYTFIVRTDDPSGAGNVDQDSRTVIIK